MKYIQIQIRKIHILYILFVIKSHARQAPLQKASWTWIGFLPTFINSSSFTPLSWSGLSWIQGLNQEHQA